MATLVSQHQSAVLQCHTVSLRTGLSPPLCVWVSGTVLLQRHLHTDVWAPVWERSVPPCGVKNKLGMCDLWLPWWRVRKWRRSGSECTTRGRKNAVSVTDSAAQWCADIAHSLPPAAAGLLPCTFTPRETFVAAVQIRLNEWTFKCWHAHTHRSQAVFFSAKLEQHC